MAFCTDCGANVADGVRFCTACGAPMAAEAPVQQPAAPPPPQAAQEYQAAYQPQPEYQPPAYQAPVYQPPAQPAYQPAPMAAPVPAAAPAPSEPPPAKGGRYAPIGAFGFIGYFIVFAIPILGLILSIKWSFDKTGNVNRRGLARAMLVFMAIALAAAIFMGIVTYWALSAVGGDWNALLSAYLPR